MRFIRHTFAACVISVIAFVTVHANVQSDEPECSRCGTTRLTGINTFQSEVVCAVARLGCVDWSDPADAELAIGRIQTFFRGRGFLDAKAEVGESLGHVSVQAGQAYLVNRIEFRGNETVSDKVIMSAVFDNLGMQFDGRILEASVRSINDLGLFEPLSIDDIRIEPVAERRLVNLVFTVTERPFRNGPPN